MAELHAIASETHKDLATEDGLARLKEFRKMSLKLSMYVSFPTSQQIVLMSSNVQKLFAYQLGTDDREKAAEEFAQNYANLFVALYSEASKYRLRTTPSATEDEALLMLFQSLLAKPNKQNHANS